jgi:hypothetical protein
MTVPRWPLLILLATGPLPGCLVIGGSSSPPAETPPPTPKVVAPPPVEANNQKFATLPSRPGQKIPANTVARTTAPPPTVAGRPPLAAQSPEAPPPPDGVMPAAGEPAALPLLAALPTTPESPLLLAVRAYVDNRPDKAIEHLKSLDKSSQDFVLAVLPLLVRGAAMKANGSDPGELAVLAEQMHASAARLESRAALRIDKVVFCQWLAGFGRYDPWPENTPYRPNNVAELYVEVRHLTSEPTTTAKGEQFTTRAVLSVEIRDAKGRIIDQPDHDDHRLRVPVRREECVEVTRTPPRDYWRRIRVFVPPAAGVYTATVEVRDVVSGRTAKSRPTQFTVAGP